MTQQLKEAEIEHARQKVHVEHLRAALDQEHEEDYSPRSADLSVMETGNTFDDSLLSGLKTDRFHEFTDSDEDDDEVSDDELDLEIQELSSEMHRIQAEVKRGGEDTYLPCRTIDTLPCTKEASIWGLTYNRMWTGGEEQQQQQMVELQRLQARLHSLFVRTRSSAASSSIQFEQE